VPLGPSHRLVGIRESLVVKLVKLCPVNVHLNYKLFCMTYRLLVGCRAELSNYVTQKFINYRTVNGHRDATGFVNRLHDPIKYLEGKTACDVSGSLRSTSTGTPSESAMGRSSVRNDLPSHRFFHEDLVRASRFLI